MIFIPILIFIILLFLAGLYLYKENKEYKIKEFESILMLKSTKLFNLMVTYQIEQVKYLSFCNSLFNILIDSINKTHEEFGEDKSNIPKIRIIFGGMNKLKNNLGIEAVFKCDSDYYTVKATKRYLSRISNYINLSSTDIYSEIIIKIYENENENKNSK